MSEEDKIIEQKVKRSGIFDFKEVYQFVYHWLNEEDYTVEERKYTEYVTGDSKKVEIKWVATKKVSDYFKNEMKLNWRIVDLTNVEVEQDGKKVKMNKGNFEVKITGNLVKDWSSTWEKNPFMKFLRGTYDKYIVEGRIKQYEIKLYGDVDELTEQIKAFLTVEGMK